MDAITTTVTWETLIGDYDSELSDLRDAYDELESLAREEYDADLTTPTQDDTLAAIQQQARQYDDGVKTIQKRQHVLETLRDELGDGPFELKMLSGEETVDIETELRMLAQQRDVSVQVIQTKRNALTVDAATVSAPDGVPCDESGPTPSQAPNALTLALWEHVERFNNAGSVDFRPEGCGMDRPASSATPTPSPTPSTPSGDTDAE